MNVKFSRSVSQDALFRVQQKLTKSTFESSAPAPFVGHKGYPQLNVGILSLPEVSADAWKHDAPRYWAQHKVGIPQVIDYRTNLINSRFKAHVKSTEKMIPFAQEIAMAAKPVDVELQLADRPTFGMTTDRVMAPTGPHAQLKKLSLTSNPSVPVHVEKAVADTDLKAGDAVTSLYGKGYDENFLSKLLSVGTLGLKDNRKLVPTRWSITATDDILAKNMVDSMRDFPESDHLAFFDGYLGNYYLILVIPGLWSYELFEMGVPFQENPWSKSQKVYATDHEDFTGRKEYASETAGGYYAARLPILEKLHTLKRQGQILCLRFITDEYTTPLGVWVVREAARKSTQAQPVRLGSTELLVQYATQLAQQKFGVDISFIFKSSVLLNQLKRQKSLKNFMNN